MPPAAPAPTATPGDDDISPYVVANEIGKGSFATVYRGYHNETRDQVAVKTVSRKLLTAKLLENLQTEIKILKALNHKHVTRLVDIIEKPRNIYLVMEFCAGGDLSNYIKRRGRVEGLEYVPAPGQAPIYYPHPRIGGLDEVVVRSFLRQLARALKFLRQRNLIHRDLKPQNLLLTPQTESDKAKGSHPVGVPILKVADFGFARSLPNAMMAETLCGSPLYMAPEILRYEKYDAKADLWSVGAVLYEMSVGKPPFRAQNHMELLRRIEHARSNVKFPDEDPSSPQVDTVTGNPIKPVPADIKQLIRSLLKRHPVERASYEDFFSSPAIANSKTRLARTRSSKPDLAAGSTSDVASTPSSSRAITITPTPVPVKDLKSPVVTSPSPIREPDQANPKPWASPAPVIATVSSPARIIDIPATHRIIPKEVLDPKAIFPPSPFDFRGRTHKAHTDLGADVSADRAETPPSSPPRRLPISLPPTGASPRRTSVGLPSVNGGSPRTRPSPKSPLPDLPEDRALHNMTTSMGETTREYVFIDTNVVEFNRKVDEISTRQNQNATGSRPSVGHGHVRAQTMAYPPDSTSDRRSSAPGSPSGRTIELAPPATVGQLGYAQAYTPTRMASNALAKALNIASKKLFGTGTGNPTTGGSPSSVESDTSVPYSGQKLVPSTPRPASLAARSTSAPASPIEGPSVQETLDRKLSAADEAENALFAGLEDLAQKTYVLGKWADSLFEHAKLGKTGDPAKTYKRHGNDVEDKAATSIAVYMVLMQFSQRALDQLSEYHEQLPPARLPGSGFDAALKWFKTSFLNSHERAAILQTWLPREQTMSVQWIEQLTYTHALELSREAARKEIFDQAKAPDECEKLYEESLWCLYALRDDMLEGGKPFMEEDRKTISDWITRTKLRLVRCRNRMDMDQNARLNDARADTNLDEAFRQPAPWDIGVGA